MADIVYKQIADALRDQILCGSLAPGDDVPTEAELGARWNASRGPIRNALALLRSEGLIETTRGRPSRSCPRKTSQPVDVYVPFTRWAKGFGRTPGAHTEQLSLKRADEATARALNIEQGSLVVQLIRLRLLERVPDDAGADHLHRNDRPPAVSRRPRWGGRSRSTSPTKDTSSAVSTTRSMQSPRTTSTRSCLVFLPAPRCCDCSAPPSTRWRTVRVL